MTEWEQDVVEMLAGCNIDGKGDPIEENEVVYALGKVIHDQALNTLKYSQNGLALFLKSIKPIFNTYYIDKAEFVQVSTFFTNIFSFTGKFC